MDTHVSVGAAAGVDEADGYFARAAGPPRIRSPGPRALPTDLFDRYTQRAHPIGRVAAQMIRLLRLLFGVRGVIGQPRREHSSSAIAIARPIVVLLFLMLFGCAGAASREVPRGPPSPLANWSVVGRAGFAYKASLDNHVIREGRATVYFGQAGEWVFDCFVPPCGEVVGAFVTAFDATTFRGRKAHATLWVRMGPDRRQQASHIVLGRVGLRVRPRDQWPDGTWTATTVLPVQATPDFVPYELEVDVPEEAKALELGVSLPSSTGVYIDPVFTVEAR